MTTDLHTAIRALRTTARNANMPGARVDAPGLLDDLRAAALELLAVLDAHQCPATVSRHTTTLYLPVTFDLPAGTTPEDYAKFLADEAAMDLEKMSLTEGEITVGVVRVDPVTDACQVPAPVDAAEPGDDYPPNLPRVAVEATMRTVDDDSTFLLDNVTSLTFDGNRYYRACGINGGERDGEYFINPGALLALRALTAAELAELDSDAGTGPEHFEVVSPLGVLAFDMTRTAPGPAPTATSNAAAAGWDDAAEGEPDAPFEPEDRVVIEPDPAMPDTVARHLGGRTGTLVAKVETLKPSRRVWKVRLDSIVPATVQVREDALRHLAEGSAD